ncbi:hypothetical protein K490DRAFT_136, partial [Saccharata proteae CBS 121410]
RRPFAVASAATLLMLQLLFLGLMSYIYGSLFQQSSRVHNFKVLMVDFDGGVIGEALSGAYQQLQAPSFPTIVHHSTTQYSTPADVRDAVCRGHYWGGIYTHPGASNRLSAALEGGQAAASYNAQDTMTYIYNAARYPAFASGLIQSNLVQLTSVSRIVYNHLNGTQALQSVNNTNVPAIQALLNPIQALASPIQPTTHGARVLYNTLSMVIPIIMQFFFIMALNTISATFQTHSHLPRLDNYLLRLLLSLLYTLVGSLSMAGYIWAFREDWAVTGRDFALTWLTLWLYMHVNMFVFDVATAYIPLKFTTFFVLTWVILNVTSTIAPFEISPGFYRWAYALPANEVYTLLVQIWSHGCAVRDYRALPVLFAWWLVGNVASVFAVRFRCGEAAAAEEA